jgi:nitrogen regulatory protein PII-like uncharacterized protein
VSLAFALLATAAAEPTLTEAQAKAAFVLNFARYIEWPASAFPQRDTPVVTCLVGRDVLGAALAALEGRAVQGRPLKVRRGVAPDEMHGCHVVVIGDAEERRVVPILRALAGQAVLTVGDSERFIDLGGAIGIVAGDERLQFEVNRGALDQAQLKAGAGLLKLARNLPSGG